MDLWQLSDLATPWAVHVVATLRVADRLAAGQREIGELATDCSADPAYLGRVLRHLTTKGLFAETVPGRFALEPAGRGLLDEGLRAGLDLDSFGGRMANAWGTLLEAVRTGKPAYHRAFGRSFWEDLEAHPAIAADFDRLMGPGHGTPDPQVLIDPAEWGRIRTVVDVGGGTGTLLAEILRAQPHVRGTLVDLPRTVERSREVFEAAGVSDRVTCAGQSFFDPLPARADLYLLKSVLSDWPDPEAVAILRRCAEAARPSSGRVAILNGVTPDERAEPELLMLVLVGGKGRTLDEFRDLARVAGLGVTAAARQPSGRFVVNCRPD